MTQRRNSNPDDLPPSYEEVVASSQPTGTSSFSPPPPSQKPQQYHAPQNARPAALPRPARPARPASSDPAPRPEDLYTNNLSLPWRYPKDYVCKRCQNTGYKVKRGERKKCRRCWAKFEPPVVYRPPPASVVPLPPGSRLLAPTGVPPPHAPKVVPPGHPSIGGVLCNNCGGRGLVSFFLDQETCRVCGGIGRVFPVQPARAVRM